MKKRNNTKAIIILILVFFIVLAFVLVRNVLFGPPIESFDGATKATSAARECGDGADNDGDGFIDGSDVDCGYSESETWSAPVGLRAPSFGILERAPRSPSPWNSAVPGFYYVDSSSAVATDTNNPQGYPGRPRRNIPANLPAGSVVQLGEFFTSGSDVMITGAGTATRPIFIRGNPRAPANVRRDFAVRGSYIIFENLEFDDRAAGSVSFHIDDPSHHVALRHSSFYDSLTTTVMVVGSSSVPVHNIVIYDNEIMNDLNGATWYDPISTHRDEHGLKSKDANYVWIIDNVMYHNNGNGIQVGEANYANDRTHHLYISRNEIHDNKQAAIALKGTRDVIISENKLYANHFTFSDYGPAVGMNYNPERIWILNNEMFDSIMGVRNGGTTDLYVLGNVIHDIVLPTSGGIINEYGYAIEASGAQGTAAILGNTVFNSVGGIKVNGANLQNVYVSNNIVHTISGIPVNPTNYFHLSVGGNPAQSILSKNVLWQSGLPLQLPLNLPTTAYLNQDPRFVNVQEKDFHLQEGSSAIDYGDASEIYPRFYDLYGVDIRKDLDGYERPAGNAWDVGAFEKGN